MPVLVLYEILGLFVYIFNVDDKYSFLNRKNLLQPVRMKLSNKLKKILNF